MNKMILRNQQEMLCHCGNTRKAKPIRQAKARLLLILAALLFGGTGWGQTTWWFNSVAQTGNHIPANQFWGNSHNDVIEIANGATVYVDGTIGVYCYPANSNFTVTIKPKTGSCTIKRGDATGELIHVYGTAGNWSAGNLTINANVTIDGNGSGLGIGIENGGSCTLTGVTMQNFNNTTPGYGGAINNSGALETKSNCIFKNNQAVSGGAVSNSGTWTATSCTIQNNTASQLGGGVFTTNSATLTSCTITGNTAGDGAGIYASNALTCTTCTITNNNTTNVTGVNKSGGGIYYCGSNTATAKATFTNGTINGNNAHYKGGGIIIHKNGTAYCELDMTGTTVYNNIAPAGGGIAVHSTGATFNLTAGDIYSNKASNDGGTTITGNGGGVHIDSGSTFNMSGGTIGKASNPNQALDGAGVYSGGTFSMTGGTITTNSASQDGGGVYVNGGTFTVSASRDIIKNTATRNGGGVYVASGGTFNSNGLVGKKDNANKAERGAGVYTAGTLNIQGGNIQYNTMTGTAKLGAGVYIAGGTTTMSGGAINNNTTAIDGAGVYINSGTFAMSSGSSGEIHTNTATGNGGGVYVASGSTFNYNGGVVGKSGGANQAANGGGVYVASNATFTMGSGTAVSYNTSSVDGAGIYLASNFTLAANRTINNNTATGNGGGIYVASGVTFTMNGGVIHTNTAKKNANYGDGGAGVYTEANTTFSMSGGEIYHNTCTDGSHGSGGGVLSNGTFNMSGGDIGRGTAIGNSSNRNYADHGGGVFVHNGTFTMSGTAQVHGNQAANGGGVYVNTNGSFVMNNGEIHYNLAQAGTQNNKGGGVYVVSGSTFTMNNGIIYSNQAKYSYKDSNDQTQYGWAHGGGVSNSGTFTMAGGSIGKYENTTRYENKGYYGGGVYSNGTFSCTGGTIAYNAGESSGGGVYVVANSTFTFDNTTIHDNTSKGHGGGIYTLGSVTATDNNNNNNTKIYNNTVTGSGHDGGGVYVGNNGSFTMTNGEIYGNRTVDGGGGIYIADYATSSLSLTNTNIYSNNAANGGGIYKCTNALFTMTGGEVYSNAATANGGGINVNGGTGTSATTLTGVSIGKENNNAYLPNTAKLGGGIYMADGTVTIQKHTTSKTDTKSYIIGNSTNITGGATGGGIHKEAGTLDISDTEITGNTSTTQGGGIYSKGTTTIDNCIIDGNTSTTNGGGIFMYSGTLTVTDSDITENTSTTATGGGIHMRAGTTTITNSDISNNSATTTGGGIHVTNNTSLTISNCTITDNTATGTGGGIQQTAGTSTTITDSEITGNTSSSTGGGIHLTAGRIDIVNSNIESNTATTNGGGIYKAGGNIYVSGVVVVNNNTKSAVASNLHIANADTKFIYIAENGLDCGSLIGITTVASAGTGASQNTVKIVEGAGADAINNCRDAYRNRFFFDDTDLSGVTNYNQIPYSGTETKNLYLVKNTSNNAYNLASATNSWMYQADAAGCTITNGFVTAVNSAAGLAYFAKEVVTGKDYSGKTVSLSADIDLSAHHWEPIGYAYECIESGTIFNGTFDGQGHTISNITSNFPYEHMGLFGVVGTDGVVKNTVIVNVIFTGANNKIGSIASLLHGKVYNCSAITVSNSSIGTTAASLVGELGEDGSLMNCFVNTSATNGLADENGGTIENCYMRGATNFVGSGSTGTVNYCYAPSGSVSGTNSVYGTTNLPNGKYGFAHSDQQITSNSGNTHIVNGAIDNHGELKGLLATLNHWVKTSGNGWNAGTQSNSNGYALWTRTMASPINGDYPVLMMPGTVCVGSTDGTILNYAADINTLLTTYSTSGDIYLYATNPTELGGTNGSTRVYINEHVGVLQTAGTTLNARVGVTLDNSSTGYMSYDWHMFSSALTAAPLGIVYHSGVNDSYLVKTNYSTYLSSGIPHMVYESAANMDPTKTTWNTTTGQIGYFPTNTPYGTWRGTPDPVGSFDFYCYHEPTCHWINFKREGTSSFYDHWRENEDPTTHTHLNIPYENESSLTPGKGYLVALSQPSMLMADGVLNNGDASGNVSINVTASDINFTGYEYTLKGINLIGNPYQSYLDFDEFASNSANTQIGNTYYILDADKKGYVSYTVGQTDPPAPKMLHPHQGFYVKVPASQSLQFTPAMRATTGAVFRDDKPSYPLVNLVCTDGQGRNDFATVELDRPEAGGGEKVLGLHSGDASVWIHTDEADWQTAFTRPGLREVPVRFKAYKDGFFTISWNTMNADFNYMHLIDNLNGTDIDCLNADEYHFEGKVTDYSSRFRLVLEYTDVEENEDDASTGSATFAFMMGDELVVNSGSSASTETALLEMFDLNGRCLLSKELHGEQSTLHLPTTAPGIYVLRLTANRQTRTQKMVIR